MSTHTASNKSSNSKPVTNPTSEVNAQPTSYANSANKQAVNNLEQQDNSVEGSLEGERKGAHMISFRDIESVDQLRDELSLQAHLLRSELKERFEKLEKEWPVLDLQIEPIRKATTQAGADVSAAVRLLFDTIKESYQDIKNSTASRH